MNTPPPTHLITVCTTCGDARDSVRPGLALLQQIADAAAASSRHQEFHVRGTECMGACRRPCAVAFSAPGKYDYLFGELSVDPMDVAAILQCALQYKVEADGLLAWSARPERLRRNVIARIPPPDALLGASDA